MTLKYTALKRLRHPQTQKVIEPGEVFECESLNVVGTKNKIPDNAVGPVLHSTPRVADPASATAAREFLASPEGEAFIDGLIEKRLAARSVPPPAMEAKAELAEPKADEPATKPETPASKGEPQQHFQRPKR